MKLDRRDPSRKLTCKTPIENDSVKTNAKKFVPEPKQLEAEDLLQDQGMLSMFSMTATKKPAVAAVMLATIAAGAVPGMPVAQAVVDDIEPTPIVTQAPEWDPIPAETANAIQRALDVLTPSQIEGLKPMGLLDGIESGRLTMRIPLKAGTYRIDNREIRIEPNSALQVQVEVAEGKLVPAKKNRGTIVELTKKIDGPVWTTIDGAYLRDGKHGFGRMMIEVGGWFDKKLSNPVSMQVGTTVRNFLGQEGKDILPKGMLRTEGMTFEVTDLRPKQDLLHLGSLFLDSGPNTTFSLKGNLRKAELAGHIDLDRISLHQDNLSFAGKNGSADIKIRTERSQGGGLTITSQLSQINGTLERAMLFRTLGPQNRDALILKNASIRDGQIETQVEVSKKRMVSSELKTFDAEVKGEIGPSRITFADAKDTATMRLSGAFDGSISGSDEDISLQGSLKKARFSLSDLQTKRKGARIDLRHAAIKGDATIDINTANKTFDVDVKGDAIDVRLDDYQGRSSTVAADLGQTILKGKGRMHLSNHGLRVAGDLQIQGAIDDLTVRNENTDEVLFDLTKGSTVAGQLRSLSIGKNGLELVGRGNVNLGVEHYDARLPGVQAKGEGRIVGRADLIIDEKQVALDNAHAALSLDVEKGSVLKGGDAFSLDIAHGSKLLLHLTKAAYGKQGTTLSLGPGSNLEAQIASGKLAVADHQIDLRGATVRFDIAELVHEEGMPQLRGRLEIGGAGGIEDVDMGLLVDHPLKLAGRGHVVIEDVSMTPDGQFILQNVDVDMSAKIGALDAASSRPQPLSRLSYLLRIAPEIETNQDLINHFYNVGGDTWEGAQDAAADYGITLTDLVEDRAAKIATEKLNAIAVAAPQAVAHVPASHPISQVDAVDPLALLGELKDGVIEVVIPVEGTVGTGWTGSADFQDGTELKIRATVKNGRIIPSKFRASFNKPGDAALWVTARGAYLDENNALKLDLGGWWDADVGVFDGAIPLEVTKLAEQLIAKRDANAPDDVSAFLVEKTRVSVKQAKFDGGQLTFPFGSFDLSDTTNISVEGNLNEAKLTGDVAFDNLDIDAGMVSFGADQSIGRLEVTYKRKGDKAEIVADLSDLNSRIRYLVYQSAGGFLDLGKVSGQGRLTITTNLSLDKDGLPGEVDSVSTDLRLTGLKGMVEGAEIVAELDDAEQPMRVRFGGSPVTDGEFRMVDNTLELFKGNVAKLDVSLSHPDVELPAGSLHVESARARGTGMVEYENGEVRAHSGEFTVDLQVKADEVEKEKIGPLKDVVVRGASAHARIEMNEFDQVLFCPQRSKGDALEMLNVENLKEGSADVSVHADKIEGSAKQ